jgi:hypothetical protein
MRGAQVRWLERCPAILSAEYLPSYQLFLAECEFPHSHQVAQRGVSVYIAYIRMESRRYRRPRLRKHSVNSQAARKMPGDSSWY